MVSVVPYSLLVAGLVLTASLTVFGVDPTTTTTTKAPPPDNPCPAIQNCTDCVSTKVNVSAEETGGHNGTCIWEVSTSGSICTNVFRPSEQIIAAIYVQKGCTHDPPPTTPAPNATTTSPSPTTSSSTTVAPNATTSTTTPPPSTTTVLPNTTTTAPNSTTTVAPTSTPAPANVTTTAAPTPKPTPAPTKGGFSWASFIGGIVFAAAVSSLAYLIWRFYKVRLDRNYHTLSTNLI